MKGQSKTRAAYFSQGDAAMNVNVTTEISLRPIAPTAERGVEHVFVNPDRFCTDRRGAVASRQSTYPRFVTVPHENAAMAMAHGISHVRQAPVVMVP